MAQSPYVVDVTEATFQTEVVDKSVEVPVLIDFWAEWCGPCKTLGPLLEQLADAYGGAIRVAKVDVDRNPQLAAYFRAESIPMVFAFFQGQPIDRFVGVQPLAELKKFVNGLFDRVGLPVPQLEAPVPKDPRAAEAHWRKALETNGDDTKAKLQLGRLLIGRGETDEAVGLFESIPASADEYSAAQAALALKELLAPIAEAGGEASVRERDPVEPETQYLLACLDATGGDFVGALEALVTLSGTAPAEVRAKAKAAAATVFGAVDRNDPIIGPTVDLLRRKQARNLF